MVDPMAEPGALRKKGPCGGGPAGVSSDFSGGRRLVKYWLMKSEPAVFSIHDLKQCPDQTAEWEGVRNYQARNYMRDEMKQGDRVLFYHSATSPPAIVGTARVVREGYPDDTAWDPASRYFDGKSSPENPRWVMVDIRFEQQFDAPVSLAELRELPVLKDMVLLRKGMRLSIQPVTKPEFEAVLRHAGAQP
jgi:predicted RNA-binding protein with PUA-like domain